MEIEPRNIHSPARKLRRLLKDLPDNAPAAGVHGLRTQARRLEAIVTALMLDSKKPARQMLKSIEPVRKAAGEVRDMDVLVAHVLDRFRGESRPAARLLKRLTGMRKRSAQELLETVDQHRKDARRSLKRFSRQIEKSLNGNGSGPASEPRSNLPQGDAARKLMSELNGWPALNAENLHSFRIKLKELRYVLQLGRNADARVLGDLGKVKDAIGDWHDWQQLAWIARKTLDHEDDPAVLDRIESIGKGKLRRALAAAKGLRRQWLGVGMHDGLSDNNRQVSAASRHGKLASSP
jgi:CHAD domain-containing protein